MNSLTIWDHLFALGLFLLYPAYSKLTFSKAIETLKNAGGDARIRLYRQVIISWLVFALCILTLWLISQRNWAELGFRMPGTQQLLIGLAVAVAVIAVVVIPLRGIARSPERAGELTEQMGDIGLFMPRSPSEEKWFKGVSLNAGLTEELIYRGYLLWYLQHFVNSWWAAAIAVLLFGYGHIYQGLKQLPGILFISAVAVFLFVYTDSLLVPVLFHVFLDAFQGHYIARIKRAQPIAE